MQNMTAATGSTPRQPMSAWARSALARWLYRADRTLQMVSGGRASLHFYLFCCQPLNAPALASVRDDPQTRVEPVAEGSVLLPLFPRPPAKLAQRFASGDSCYAVLVKDQFAGHIWLNLGEHQEDEVRCRYVLPEAAAVWDFDVYIAPPFRSTRAFWRLWTGVSQALQAQHINLSYSRISLFNAASVQAHERMGARHLLSGVFLTLGAFQVAVFSRPWRLRVTLPGQAPPVIQLPLPPTLNTEDTAAGGQPAAMVLGLDSHGLATARALADAGVPVYAMEWNLTLPGVRSNRVRQVFPVNSFSAEHLVPALLAARQVLAGHPQVALLAVNDRQVETIAAQLGALQPAYGIAWADKSSDLLRLQSKTELQAVCERQGLLYPRSVTFSAVQDHGLTAKMRYPLILKPARPLSSFKTLLARDAQELYAHVAAHPQDLPILCQEYVAGDDRQIFFGAMMLDRGKVLGAMAGRKLASHPPARGQTITAETVNAPEVLRLTERFFDGLELSGPVSLELKLDREGRYWVIEPTVGRTDFWAELCFSAGFNQALAEFELAIGRAGQPMGKLRNAVWFDSERSPMSCLAYWLSAWRSLPLGRRHAFSYLGHGDWAPFQHSTSRLIKTLIRRPLEWLRRSRRAAP